MSWFWTWQIWGTGGTPSRKQSKGWWDSGSRLQEIEWGWRCRFKDNRNCRSVLIKEEDQVEIEVAEISSLENAFDSWKGKGEKPVKEGEHGLKGRGWTSKIQCHQPSLREEFQGGGDSQRRWRQRVGHWSGQPDARDLRRVVMETGGVYSQVAGS